MLYLQMSSVDEGSSKSDDIDGSKLLRITSSAIINICICKQQTANSDCSILGKPFFDTVLEFSLLINMIIYRMLAW